MALSRAVVALSGFAERDCNTRAARTRNVQPYHAAKTNESAVHYAVADSNRLHGLPMSSK